MSEVVGADKFAQRQATIRREHMNALLQKEWEEMEERKAKHIEEGKCCATLENGQHPEDDWHLCLRTKGHKGYCMDKITGLSWKWEVSDE